MPKQLAATGLIVISGLLIFLIIGLIAPNSNNIIDAGREFDTQPFVPSTIVQGLPPGLGVFTSMVPSKPLQGPLNLDLTKGYILSDHDQRMSKDFQIPEDLKRETALYFDLFTKYSRDSWLIISEEPAASVIEEWSSAKLANYLVPPVTPSKIRELLNTRMASLAKIHSSLRIQRGLREDFLEQVKKQKKWLPIVENMFKKQRLPKELSRIFIVPNNSSLEEFSAPWTSLNSHIVSRYLLKNAAINENKSPVKVARALATVLKKQRPHTLHWNLYFEGSANLDARFFAALYADVYRDELNFEKTEILPFSNMKAFKLSRKTSIGELVQQLKIELPVFFENNPDLLQKGRQVVLPKTYVFFVAK